MAALLKGNAQLRTPSFLKFPEIVIDAEQAF